MLVGQDLGLVKGRDYFADKRVADNVFHAKVDDSNAPDFAKHLYAFFKA